MVNVLKFVFNTQFVVSKHDHIQQSQQTLETKLLTISNVFISFSPRPVHENENYAMIYSHSSHPRCI